MKALFDSSLLAFAGLALLLSVTPGPDMALVTRNAIREGPSGVLLTVAGLSLGLAWWTAATALGVSALVQASRLAFTLLRIAGALYLGWLGLRSLLRKGGEEGRLEAPRVHGSFRQGIVSAGLNPKLGVFFLAILPQFVRPGQPPALRILVLGLVFIAIGVTWLLAYGFAVVAIREALGSPRLWLAFERVSGAVLLGLAAFLLLAKF